MSAKRIATNAVCIAIYTLLSYISIDFLNVIRLSFALFPIIVVALRFGCMDGMIVGAVGGFLNQLLKYGVGSTTVLWIIPAMAEGMIIGLYAQRKGFQLTSRQTAGVVLAGGLVVTTLNTLALYFEARIVGYPSNLTALAIVLRYVSSILMTVVYTILTPQVVRLLRKSGV